MRGTRPSARTVVQGKPVARRGRKARGLDGETAQLPARGRADPSTEGDTAVKANLARFTMAIMLLACMALTVGAGMRWY